MLADVLGTNMMIRIKIVVVISLLICINWIILSLLTVFSLLSLLIIPYLVFLIVVYLVLLIDLGITLLMVMYFDEALIGVCDYVAGSGS